MKNFEKLEELLQRKTFHELTAEERELVLSEIGKEEEYESLRMTERGLQKSFVKKTELSVNPDTLKKIKARWKQKKDISWENAWSFASLPNYATLLLLSVVGFLGWMGGSLFQPKIVFVERIKHQVDTVLIASKPDTVIRTVYLKSPVVNPLLQTVQTIQPIVDAPVKGVSMKEKESLERLLVSGSD